MAKVREGKGGGETQDDANAEVGLRCWGDARVDGLGSIGYRFGHGTGSPSQMKWTSQTEPAQQTIDQFQPHAGYSQSLS